MNGTDSGMENTTDTGMGNTTEPGIKYFSLVYEMLKLSIYYHASTFLAFLYYRNN